MPKRKLLAVGLLASFLPPTFLSAAEPEYRTIDGVQYQVSRRTVSRPVSESQIIEREQKVLRQQYVTEVRDSTRVVTVPITEYRWEAEWRNRWNPFGTPYMVQRLVPRTSWQTHTEVVQVPVTKPEWVSETRVVQVPVTSRRFEPVEQLVLSPVASDAATVARRTQVGGVEKLDGLPKTGSKLPIQR